MVIKKICAMLRNIFDCVFNDKGQITKNAIFTKLKLNKQHLSKIN